MPEQPPGYDESRESERVEFPEEVEAIVTMIKERLDEDGERLEGYLRLPPSKEVTLDPLKYSIFLKLVAHYEMEELPAPMDEDDESGEEDFGEEVYESILDCQRALKRAQDQADTLPELFQIAKALILVYERFGDHVTDFDLQESLQVSIYRSLAEVFPDNDPVILKVREHVDGETARLIDTSIKMSQAIQRQKRLKKDGLLPPLGRDRKKPLPSIGSNALYVAVEDYVGRNEIPFADLMTELLRGFPAREQSASAQK